MDNNNLFLLFEVKEKHYHISLDKEKNSLFIYNSNEEIGVYFPIATFNHIAELLINMDLLPKLINFADKYNKAYSTNIPTIN